MGSFPFLSFSDYMLPMAILCVAVLLLWHVRRQRADREKKTAELKNPELRWEEELKGLDDRKAGGGFWAFSSPSFYSLAQAFFGSI